MPKSSRRLRFPCLIALFICLLPAFAAGQQAEPNSAAQATAPAAGTAAPPATTVPRRAGRRTPPDAQTQEKDLGLKSPANPELPSLILIGDSTVRNGHGRGDNNQWGWGHPLAEYFDAAKINVVNRAIGGLSSHSYISGGHWALALEIIKPGDFVLIQFGHNDGGLNIPGTKPIPDQGLAPGAKPPAWALTRGPNVRGSLPGIGDESYEFEDRWSGKTETVHTFGWYLRKYIADVKAKGAMPIICSLVPRKIWVDGHIRRNTSTYRGWARQVAEEEHVGFVDLNEIIARCYDAMGPEKVEGLFGDPHTHTDWAGAVINAEAVVSGLRDLPGDPLAKYLSAKGEAVAAYKP